MIGCLLAISKQVWPHVTESFAVRESSFKSRGGCLILFIPFLDRIKGHHVGYLTTPFGRTIISFSVAYLIASVITVKGNNTYKLLNHPVMVYIGMLSYSIYIWQQFFLLPNINAIRQHPNINHHRMVQQFISIIAPLL